MEMNLPTLTVLAKIIKNTIFACNKISINNFGIKHQNVCLKLSFQVLINYNQFEVDLTSTNQNYPKKQ